MTDLYIIRHGETEWNVQRRIQGLQNSPLSSKGVAQTLDLSNQLLKIPFSKCYCSPMPRAIHTAHLLRGQRDFSLIVEPLLSEMNLGLWEGRLSSELKKEHPEMFEAFLNRADLFSSDINGESFESVINRAKTFLHQFEKPAECNEPILCITHCILIQALTMVCENRQLPSLRTAHPVKQSAPFLFRYNNDKMSWTVEYKNGLILL